MELDAIIVQWLDAFHERSSTLQQISYAYAALGFAQEGAHQEHTASKMVVMLVMTQTGQSQHTMEAVCCTTAHHRDCAVLQQLIASS